MAQLGQQLATMIKKPVKKKAFIADGAGQENEEVGVTPFE